MVLQGFLAASIFSLSYYAVPGWLIAGALQLAHAPKSTVTIALITPIVLSAIIPPISARKLLHSGPFKYISAYFQYREILETPHDDLVELVSSKPTLICLHPHGVFTFVALCAATNWSKKWWDPATTPTAVASSVVHMPLLKHIIGILGLVSASAKPLVKTLQDESNRGVILYPGGTSELFLTNHERERIFILQRKGFIKIALTQGCAIVPGYLFGNSRVLRLLDWSWLRAFSRKTGIAITYFYGRFYLPLPLPYPCLCAIGTPIHLPKIDSPTDEEVDYWHKIYVSEVKRIFDTYKVQAIGYENTELEIE